MTLEELAHAAAAEETSPDSCAARSKINRRVAKAKIDAANTQRDAADAQKNLSWTAWAFIPSAFLGVIVVPVIAKL
jgi:hypothetical protein